MACAAAAFQFVIQHLARSMSIFFAHVTLSRGARPKGYPGQEAIPRSFATLAAPLRMTRLRLPDVKESSLQHYYLSPILPLSDPSSFECGALRAES